MSGWDNLRIQDLERFAAVIEAGSFTAAGRALDESPKQLSRRISLLEASLGTRLFHRTTRSLRPTAEGTRWYADVRLALDRLHEATAEIRPGALVQGRVRVQIPTLFMDEVLAWWATAEAAHPGLSLDLLIGDRADDLLGRGIDVCLSGVAPVGATVRVRRVGLARPTLYARADYLQRHGSPSEPEDLRQHECLRFVGPTPQHRWTLTHDDGARVEVAIGGRLACNDSRALLRALWLGLGIGPLAAAPPPVPGAAPLIPVLPGWGLGGIEMWLALAPGRGQLSAVRYVADALAALTTRILGDLPTPTGSAPGR